MATIIEAVYDGEVLRPEEPLPIKPNTRVTVTVEVPVSSGRRASFLETALSIHLQGPPDWSENIDSYLQESRLSGHD
jgi:predicted DNA-binding antitoxin AbrB/MazE fold protein